MTTIQPTFNPRQPPWSYNTPESRWYGFGRYFAMFPPAFAYEAIDGLTEPGDLVLDPFCGRGNGPFTATVLQRPAFGIDVNPVAWIFTAAKLQPAPDPQKVIARLIQVARASKPRDRRGRDRFERMAWAPAVRAFLRAARRELNWRNSRVDRILMAFIALHMQDKIGVGLSNGLWPTIACSPRYAVRWWTERGMLAPPDVDPVRMLTDKIQRRYRYGIPDQAQGTSMLADARQALSGRKRLNAGLLLTSPPYCGVADYWNDHWLRLWILGYPFRKDWKQSAKFANAANYRSLITSVFRESRRHLNEGAAVLVRSDQRRQTARMCIEALQEVWPNREILVRATESPHNSISVHHGHGGRKAKEIDLLLPGSRYRDWGDRHGFYPIETVADYAAIGNK